MTKFVLPFFFITVAFAASNTVTTKYLDFGDTGHAQLLAADASGNLFAAGLVTEPSGLGQIRVIKTDPSGNPLASIDFGGNGADSVASAAVDPQGNIVIVGSTPSPDFPQVNALALTPQPRTPAAFIVKIDAQLKTILLSTLLGGTNGSFALGSAVAVDSKGNLYVAGWTNEKDFPTTANAYQSTLPSTGVGSQNGTVTEISAQGQILFSTFYGSPSLLGTTVPSSIAVDASGNVFVAGTSTTTDPPPATSAGFVVKFSPGLSKLTWATPIPDPDNYMLTVSSIALETDGSVVLGGASSVSLPPPPSPPPAAQRMEAGKASPGIAGFIARLDASSGAVLSSLNVGGSLNFASTPQPIAVDSQGIIWTTGVSYVDSIASNGATIVTSFTAPTDAVGQAIVVTANGPVTLGPTGSLLIGGNPQAPSLLGIANSAATRVSGITTPLELISLYGVGIGPSTPLTAQIKNIGPGNQNVVTSSLGGYQVLFNGIAAPLLYVGANQINAIVPASAGYAVTATVQIVTPNGTIAGPTLRVRPSQPQVFGTLSGLHFAAAINQDGTLNSEANPAPQGSVVTVWATGAGLFSPYSFVDGSILGPGGPLYLASYDDVTIPLPVSVLTETQYIVQSELVSVQVPYAGAAPNAVQGVLQINFVVTGTSTYQLQIGSAISDPFWIWFPGLSAVAN